MIKLTYLADVFTTGGSIHATHEALSGQAFKVQFKLKAYIYKFKIILISHMLALFDKLILPILTFYSLFPRILTRTTTDALFARWI